MYRLSVRNFFFFLPVFLRHHIFTLPAAMTTFAADPFGICFLLGILALSLGQGNEMIFDILHEQEYTSGKDNQFLLSIMVLILLATFLFFVTWILDLYVYGRRSVKLRH